MAAPQTPTEKITRWALRPLEALRALPDGDGAFAALTIGCGLYERFIHSLLHRQGVKATPANFKGAAAADLNCPEEAFDRFWNGYRLGMQHSFQPKNYVEKQGKGDKWGWQIAEGAGYEKQPEIRTIAAGHYVVRVDPWKFVGHVMQRWQEQPQLLGELKEFSFGEVADD